MKTIKTIANSLISIAMALLMIQALLALLVNFVPASTLANLVNMGVKISGQAGLTSLAVLLIRNGLCMFGLGQVKTLVKHFQISDLMTETFAIFVKKAGVFVLVTELFSSYLETLQAPFGTYVLDVKYGVCLILAGFACDYARRFMVKNDLTF